MRLGRTRAEMPTKTCDYCDGGGYTSSGETCDACDGTGRLFAETPRHVLQGYGSLGWHSLLIDHDFEKLEKNKKGLESIGLGIRCRIVQEQDEEMP